MYYVLVNTRYHTKYNTSIVKYKIVFTKSNTTLIAQQYKNIICN